MLLVLRSKTISGQWSPTILFWLLLRRGLVGVMDALPAAYGKFVMIVQVSKASPFLVVGTVLRLERVASSMVQ